MSATNAFENSLLSLIFNNTNIANIGDATGLRGSATPGNLHVALHTADPGEAGSAQTTNEIAYTGYSRQPTARPAGWTVAGNTASNAVVVTFGPCTGGTATATHFSIGTDASGTGTLLFKGALASPITITSSSNQTQTFAIGALSITAD
jgi:hypothetical protein